MVVEDIEFSAYMVCRRGKPDSDLRKFMTENMYMLHPAILPCEHLVTPDMWYLNSKLHLSNTHLTTQRILKTITLADLRNNLLVVHPLGDDVSLRSGLSLLTLLSM